MTWLWVERDGFLVRYVVPQNSRNKDTERIRLAIFGNQRMIPFTRYKEEMGEIS